MMVVHFALAWDLSKYMMILLCNKIRKKELKFNFRRRKKVVSVRKGDWLLERNWKERFRLQTKKFLLVWVALWFNAYRLLWCFWPNLLQYTFSCQHTTFHCIMWSFDARYVQKSGRTTYAQNKRKIIKWQSQREWNLLCGRKQTC